MMVNTFFTPFLRVGMVLAAVLMIQTAWAQPANDDCSNATPIACGDVVTGSTTGATTDGAPFCGTSNTAPGVWYEFTGNGDFVSVSTCGSSYDTKLTVYTGSCGSFTCVGGDDDDFTCSVSLLHSLVEFASVPGETYYILVHGFGSSTGTYELSVDCVSGPENDLCSDALPIECGETVNGTTVNASNDGAPFCGTSNTAPGVWYTFVGTGGDVTASTCGPGFDTKLTVYTGSCGSFTCVGGDDDDPTCSFSSLRSRVDFTSVAGETYYILVHGFGSSSGNFELSITCAGPENDDCSNAAPIACGESVSGSTDLATIDDAPFCGTGVTSPGVWYALVGEGDEVTASLCGSDYDTKLSVYTGSCGDLVCVAGNDDFCGLQSQVGFVALPGETYYILVHGFGGGTGDYNLTLECSPICDVNIVGCPENVTVSAMPGECGAMVEYEFPELLPDCNIEWLPNRGTIGSGGFFPVGMTVESYSVVDDQGNRTNCGFVVMVEDNEAPSITCPTEVTVFEARPGTYVAFWDEPMVMDNCGAENVTATPSQPSGSLFPIGNNTVTYTATDDGGNSVSCSFSFVVEPSQSTAMPGGTPVVGELGFAGTDLSLFPNPTGGLVTLNMAQLEGLPATIEVVNALGARVSQFQYMAAAPQEQLDLSGLASGVYIVRIVSNGELKLAERLIVK